MTDSVNPYTTSQTEERAPPTPSDFHGLSCVIPVYVLCVCVFILHGLRPLGLVREHLLLSITRLKLIDH